MKNNESVAGEAALSSEDYNDIVEAVMETTRGRWFLAEYSKRNRMADTTELLEAISRLQATIPAESAAASPGAAGNGTALRKAIHDMAQEITSTKSEIASIGGENRDGGGIESATAELDAVVSAAEQAASDILEAAEAVQEMAWTLREENVADAYCDALDMRATEIYTACSFQDITGQRTQKVVRLLQNLDQRISTLSSLWADGESGDDAANNETAPQKDDHHLLNGPALGNEGVTQDEVDLVMDQSAWSEDSTEEATAEEHSAKTEEDHAVQTKSGTAEIVDGTTDVAFEDLSQKDMDALFA